jgi:peptidoglycan lytic transglycosylase
MTRSSQAGRYRNPWDNNPKQMRTAFALVLGVIALSGCAHRRTASHTPPPPPPAPAAAPGAPSSGTKTASGAADTRVTTPPATASETTTAPLSTETGIASWYGYPYHGRHAANGEIYDMEQMTAAHRTLPFDTMVRVVNLNNEQTVEVRITDRGPFIDGRIIDLSHAAARAIGMIGPGTAPVRMEVITWPAPKSGSYAVQVGAFRDKASAERIRARMASQYGAAKVVFREGKPAMWRVLVGSEKTEQGADALRLRIHRESGERIAFVVRLDS